MEKLTLKDANRKKVAALVSIPKDAKSVVILSHGFGSSKDSKIYGEFQNELNTTGIGTIRYDYYGHGPLYCKGKPYSVQADVTLSNAVASLNAVIAHSHERNVSVGLLGSSFGGLVSLIAASTDPAVKALALKSPVLEPVNFWGTRLGVEGIKHWATDGQMHYTCVGEDYVLDFDFWRDLQKYDTSVLAKNIRCPTLIVHGEKDTIVPLTQTQEFLHHFEVPLHIVPGADHNYATPEQHTEMKQALVSFLQKKLA